MPQFGVPFDTEDGITDALVNFREFSVRSKAKRGTTASQFSPDITRIEPSLEPRPNCRVYLYGNHICTVEQNWIEISDGGGWQTQRTLEYLNICLNAVGSGTKVQLKGGKFCMSDGSAFVDWMRLTLPAPLRGWPRPRPSPNPKAIARDSSSTPRAASTATAKSVPSPLRPPSSSSVKRSLSISPAPSPSSRSEKKARSLSQQSDSDAQLPPQQTSRLVVLSKQPQHQTQPGQPAQRPRILKLPSNAPPTSNPSSPSPSRKPATSVHSQRSTLQPPTLPSAHAAIIKSSAFVSVLYPSKPAPLYSYPLSESLSPINRRQVDLSLLTSISNDEELSNCNTPEFIPLE